MQETLFTAPPLDSSLVPLDEKDILDPVGEEVQRVKQTETRIWKLVSLFEASLLVLILPVTAFLAYRVSQPVVRWMRINTMGQVQAIQYNDLNYTHPKPWRYANTFPIGLPILMPGSNRPCSRPTAAVSIS
jgi:hypothetical protein